MPIADGRGDVTFGDSIPPGIGVCSGIDLAALPSAVVRAGLRAGPIRLDRQLHQFLGAGDDDLAEVRDLADFDFQDAGEVGDLRHDPAKEFAEILRRQAQMRLGEPHQGLQRFRRGEPAASELVGDADQPGPVDELFRQLARQLRRIVMAANRLDDLDRQAPRFQHGRTDFFVTDAEDLLFLLAAFRVGAGGGRDELLVFGRKQLTEDQRADVAEQGGDEIVVGLRLIEEDRHLPGDDRAGDRFLPVLPHRRVSGFGLERRQRQAEDQRAERLDAEHDGGPLDRGDRPGQSEHGGVDGLQELPAEAGILLQ